MTRHLAFFVLLALGVALMTLSAFGATINVSTFSQLSTACTSTAQEGDTVQITSSFAIPSGITIDRGISFTIAGQGTNVTALTSTGSSGFCIWIKSQSTNVFTVRDMTCLGGPSDSFGFWLTGGNVDTTPVMAGPVHFYNIRMPQVYYRGIYMGSGDSFGLIDHCYFETAQAGQFNPVAFQGNGYRSWANASPYGTTNACYVEDCYFKTRAGWYGNGFWDAYGGAQYVLRHNIFDGSAANGDHGYDSDQFGGARSQEIYNNLFTNITSGALLNQIRAGGELYFSNTVIATGVPIANITPEIKYYRACDGSVNTVSNYVNVPQILTWTVNPSNGDCLPLLWGNCTYRWVNTLAQKGDIKIGATLSLSISNLAQGIQLYGPGSGTAYHASTETNTDVQVKSFTSTSLTVTNRLDGTNGWPAAFQPGVIGMTKYTGNAVRYPIYGWANTINGTNFGFALSFQGNSCNGQTNYVDFLLQSGRDYFQDTDGHWAGPPVGYTPLIYPHPLNSVTPSSGPPPIAPIVLQGRFLLQGKIIMLP